MKSCLQRWRNEIEQDIQGGRSWGLSLSAFSVLACSEGGTLGGLSATTVYTAELGVGSVTSFLLLVLRKTRPHTPITQPRRDSSSTFLGLRLS